MKRQNIIFCLFLFKTISIFNCVCFMLFRNLEKLTLAEDKYKIFSIHINYIIM